MKVQDIEIPLKADRGFVYRFFEILPAFLSYLVFALPFIISAFSPSAAAYFLILYILIWFSKSLAISIRVFQGYGRVKKVRKIDWKMMLDDLAHPGDKWAEYSSSSNSMLRLHSDNLRHIHEKAEQGSPKVDEVIHAVMIATYNESQDIIHPTVEDVLASSGINVKENVALFVAYENRAGEGKKRESLETAKKYSEQFMYATAIGHELQGEELVGKGGNATYAARQIKKWAEERGIDPSRVLITVLDADNRPDTNYLAALTYTYIVADNRKHKSFQPIAMYTNNIWDVPAIMRISAINNSFFHTANSMRIHALRNFSAHTQSLDALIDSDFWSVRTVVEDGHQFWRMYFRYDGDHEVVPIYAPIYQDAVLASTYRSTIVAQFKQIRRWTYGASDIAYMATRAFFMPNKISKIDAIFKFLRLLENHVAWASSSLLLIVAAWAPLIVVANPDDSIVALQLPSIISKVNLIGLVAIFSSMFIGYATLPPKPAHYKRTKYAVFFFQWALLPLVGVVFNSFAAYYAQTRLAMGRYFESFDVTEKAVKQPKS